MSSSSFLSSLFSRLPESVQDFFEDLDHGYLLLPQFLRPAIQQNAAVDSTATDGHGHLLTGSGVPATGLQVTEQGHNELAIYMGYRTGDFIQPASVSPDGDLLFNGRAGAQVIDPAHNVTVARADRGAMAEGWSFDTGANGPGGMTQQQFLAAGGQEIIKIDLDPGAGEKNLILKAVYDAVHNPGGSHIVWQAADNTFAAQGIHQGDILVADDGGNQYTTQNTTNLAFFNNLIDHNPNQAGIQSGPIAPAGDYGFEVETVGTNHAVMLRIDSTLHLTSALLA